MKGLFERDCLQKVKKNELPTGTRIIGSRFQYKIKRHHVGNDRLNAKRLNARLVAQGHHPSHSKGDFTDAFSPEVSVSRI
jgi:hypothetical protein